MSFLKQTHEFPLTLATLLHKTCKFPLNWLKTYKIKEILELGVVWVVLELIPLF